MPTAQIANADGLNSANVERGELMIVERRNCQTLRDLQQMLPLKLAEKTRKLERLKGC